MKNKVQDSILEGLHGQRDSGYEVNEANDTEEVKRNMRDNPTFQKMDELCKKYDMF